MGKPYSLKMHAVVSTEFKVRSWWLSEQIGGVIVTWMESTCISEVPGMKLFSVQYTFNTKTTARTTGNKAKVKQQLKRQEDSVMKGSISMARQNGSDIRQ